MRKLCISLAAGVLGCALAPGLAGAAGPVQWLSDGTPIPAGTVEPVATSGSLTITLHTETGAPGGAVKCKVVDNENIQNGPNGGIDELTALAFSNCKGKGKPVLCPPPATPEVNALGLPWHSKLVAGPPIRDEFTGVKLELRCSNGAVLGVYSGTLSPEVGASVLVFGPGSGLLSSGSGFAEIEGKDKLKGPKGDTKITAA